MAANAVAVVRQYTQRGLTADARVFVVIDGVEGRARVYGPSEPNDVDARSYEYALGLFDALYTTRRGKVDRVGF